MTVDGTVNDLLEVIPRDELRRMIARRGKAGPSAFVTALYDDLDQAIERLEAAAHLYQGDGELKLTNFIANQLVAMGYSATCETDVRGHTDLKVENSRAKVVWIAEAKRHHDYVTNLKGMRALLTRYASGKHEHLGFLLYIFGHDAASVLATWKDRVEQDGQLACVKVDAESRTVFRSMHTHPSSGFDLTVRHHGVILAYDPQDT